MSSNGGEPLAAALYEAMFEASPDALLLVDQEGVIVHANGAAASILGYRERGELHGLSVDRLVPERVRPRHAAFRAGYARAPRARPMGLQSELVAMRPDGSEARVEIALSPIDADGVRYTLAALREVSQYPRVQRTLKRARYGQQAALLAQAAMDAPEIGPLVAAACHLVAQALHVPTCLVFLLDRDGELLRVAGGVGLLPGEQVGDLIVNSADSPPGYVIARGVPVVVSDYTTETRFAVPETYLAAGLHSALAVPLADRGRMVGALAARSTGEGEFGDEEVRFMQAMAGLLTSSVLHLRAEEWLRHTQRLDSLGQLTGGVAHDFNNLLTVILGNLQVVAERAEEPALAALRAPVEAATRAARRGADLTARLLAFARRQVLQPSRVDAAKVMTALADMLRRTLDERLTLHLHGVDEGPGVFCRADAAQLESALLNLAINSRDAMPDGGALHFSLRSLDHLPDDVARAWPMLAAGAYVELVVRDEGPGMSEAVRARAFEPFFTTKEGTRGTGLGLSTVYGFMQQSLGAVSLHSMPGQGTTVALYLPAWPRGPVPAEPTGRAAVVPASLRVLMVEDDAAVRAVVRHYLAGPGREVLECASAGEALAILERDARFDLLLSDIALGVGMRGSELAERVNERWPALPVLLMTGYAIDPQVQAQRWPTLAKPFQREALLKALAAACRPDS